ncbi:MAG: hypothetical protein A2Y76_04955 [Planctomycetes bacterium RBG_13_60_9]|nr:MAG: hypothetical protein A2Y76_04955 [Planctomycetes bacterium RBG_13_60_9]
MDGNSPKVSIVLPTYNGAKYIQQSLDSCLNQTYSNTELIVVDDGSSDETPQIVQSCKDRRIRYLRHPTNKGLPRALNTGFNEATGDYLTWTSDDNLFLRDAVEKMVRFSQAGDHAFVFADYYRFKGEDASLGTTLTRLPDDPPLNKGNCIGYCFLYSREVRDRIGDYDPGAQLVEDYDYWIRVSKQFRLAHLNEALYLARFHDESLYAKRYWEIKVIDFLLRLRHGLLDAAEATRLFTDLAATKGKRFRRVRKNVAALLLSTSAGSVFRDYQQGQTGLQAAKSRLQSILERWPL